MVATSQPLATEAGLRILRQGGTAGDAAVAVVGNPPDPKPLQPEPFTLNSKL